MGARYPNANAFALQKTWSGAMLMEKDRHRKTGFCAGLVSWRTLGHRCALALARHSPGFHPALDSALRVRSAPHHLQAGTHVKDACQIGCRSCTDSSRSSDQQAWRFARSACQFVGNLVIALVSSLTHFLSLDPVKGCRQLGLVVGCQKPIRHGMEYIVLFVDVHSQKADIV
jgi:hypothetical protein